MSTQVISVIVLLLSQLLPYIGVTVESASLEKSIQTIVAVVAGVVIWYRRTQLRKVEVGEKSDVTLAGINK